MKDSTRAKSSIQEKRIANNDGFRVAILGGGWHYGAVCGAWCLALSNASSSRYRTVGGRLLYVPQTKISA